MHDGKSFTERFRSKPENAAKAAAETAARAKARVNRSDYYADRSAHVLACRCNSGEACEEETGSSLESNFVEKILGRAVDDLARNEAGIRRALRFDGPRPLPARFSA
jgi:hypothetical protein